MTFFETFYKECLSNPKKLDYFRLNKVRFTALYISIWGDKYSVYFDIFPTNLDVDDEDAMQEDTDLIRAITNALKAVGLGDVTISEREKRTLTKVAELLKDYSPFLEFSLTHHSSVEYNIEYDDEDDEDSLPQPVYIAKFQTENNVFSRIKSSEIEMEIDEIITESVYQAIENLKVREYETITGKVAEFIAYDDVVFTMKKKPAAVDKDKNEDEDEDGTYIVQVQKPAPAAAAKVQKLPSTPQETEIEDTNLLSAIHTALNQNNIVVESYHDLTFRRVSEVLDELKNENIVFRIRADKTFGCPKGFAGYPGTCYRAEFKDMEKIDPYGKHGKIIAFDNQPDARKAIINAVNRIINKMNLKLKY